MTRRIWVWTEIAEDAPDRLSLELLTPARAMGSVEAVVLHPASDGAIAELGNHGAAVVHHGANQEYADYVVEPQVATLAAMIQAEQPDLILFPSTFTARDIQARLVGKLGVGAITNAVAVTYGDDGGLVATVPYGGETTGKVTLDGSGPHLVQIRPKSYVAEQVGGTAEVRTVDVAVDPATLRVKIAESEVLTADGPNLEDATIIVSGGRGLGQPDNYVLVEELAKELGGAPGATRAIVDAGWVPYSYQVGQTGKTVKPNLYVACGISGAIQHVAGMKGSRHLIAINRDPDAAIFEIADLGIVGDVLTIVPKLTEKLRG